MCTATAPLTASVKFALVESLLAELAGEDVASGPVAVAADGLRALERVDAVGAACRARLLAVFDARQGCVDDGQRTTRTWLVNSLLVARGANAIPDQYRACAEDILAGAARRGADLQGLARLCAEILARTAPPDPDKDPDDDPRLDRSVVLDTTIDGVGVLRGDLTTECAAMVQSPSAAVG